MNLINISTLFIEKKFDKCVLLFNKVFTTYQDKIDFLEKTISNPFFINDDKKYKYVKKSIGILVKNAQNEKSRKYQQKKLMPVIGLIQTENDINKIRDSFMKNERDFSFFCIMYISFLYEESLKDHGQKHHEHMIVALKKVSTELVELNKKNK